MIILFKKLAGLIKHYSIHAFGLALSLSGICYTLTQFSVDPIIKDYLRCGGIFAGLAIQYLRGLAATYRKRDQKVTTKKGEEISIDRRKAVGLWIIVILGICVFDFMSSLIAITSQVDKGEQQYNSLITKRNEIQADIHDIEGDIKDKKIQQNIEFGATKRRGLKYDQFDADIKSFESKKAVKKAEFDKIQTKIDKLNKTDIARFCEMSGTPIFWIEFSISFGLMFLIYFVPLLTPWRVRIPGENDDTISNNVTGNTETLVISNTTRKSMFKGLFRAKKEPLKVTNETLHETAVTSIPVTVTPESVTYDSEMCICGCGEPRRSGSKYHSNACKTKMSRRRKAEQLQHIEIFKKGKLQDNRII